MNTPDLLAISLTALCVIGVIVYRVAWAGSSVASASAMGRLPKLPRRLRNWLLGDRHNTTHSTTVP